MLKPKDVVRIDNKYETVSFVTESCNQFKIIGRDKFYDNYINNNYYISGIDKDENGEPIILRYGEDVEFSQHDSFDELGIKTEKFLGCFNDLTMKFQGSFSRYKYARPIQEKKEDYLIEIDRKFYDSKLLKIIDKHNALAKVVMDGK